MSAFARWFNAQHGPRKNMAESDDELRIKVVNGERARAELEHRKIWDEKHTSALYAWKITDAEKATAGS